MLLMLSLVYQNKASICRLHLYEGIISATAAVVLLLLLLLLYWRCRNCTAVAASATVLLLLFLVYQIKLWQPLYANNNLSVTSQLVWSVVTTNCHRLWPSKLASVSPLGHLKISLLVLWAHII